MTSSPPDPPEPVVRPAIPADVPAMHALIGELAAYEREPHAVVATAGDLHTALFSPSPRLHAFVGEVRGEVAGMALWFVSYSTWRGRHGIWLEDLVVSGRHRGRGVGEALLRRLAAECVARGWARVEWSVLDWNAPAIGFYRGLGASALQEWTTWRLDRSALVAAAGPPAPGPRRADQEQA